VRELENFAERLLLTRPGERLAIRHFRDLMRTYRGREAEGVGPATPAPQADAGRVRGAAVDLDRPLSEVVDEAVENVERAYLESLLAETGGRIGDAARHADVSRRTLLRKLTRYDIDKRRFRS
jgi:DNA-binding NtrC family response regulator